MIACGFEDVREYKPAVSGKNPVHPVHRCESKIYPCLTMNRFPATRRRGLFQVSRAPAPPDGADHSRVKQGLFQTSTAPAPHDGADHSRVKQVLFQISRAPALPGGSFEGETTDPCDKIGTWRGSGSYAPFDHWCPVPQGKSGSEQAIIH